MLVALDVAEGMNEADVSALARAQADRQFVTVFGPIALIADYIRLFLHSPTMGTYAIMTIS